MTAQLRGWGPAPTPRSQIVQVRTASGVTFPGGVHEGIAPLVQWLCDETERRGYRLVSGWCWGYAPRKVRGGDSWSNHAWGLAVDINAPKNPMTDRLVTDMPDWMPRLWKSYGFRWGGDYSGRKDAMHYEFMGTPADARRYIEQIGDEDMPSAEDIAKAVWNYKIQQKDGEPNEADGLLLYAYRRSGKCACECKCGKS